MKEKLVPAGFGEAEEILEFYHGFIGTKGCTWNRDYPAMEHVEMDIGKGNLFLLRDEKGIVATISIDSDASVDTLECWRIKNAAEAARLGVREDMQSRGIARFMLQGLMEVLKDRGYEGIHFLVSPDNPAALASYSKLGFDNIGETFLYEHRWYCYEKRLNETK